MFIGVLVQLPEGLQAQTLHVAQLRLCTLAVHYEPCDDVGFGLRVESVLDVGVRLLCFFLHRAVATELTDLTQAERRARTPYERMSQLMLPCLRLSTPLHTAMLL